jgi:hypothetical protein
MERMFVVTLWSGGSAGKRWQTHERPEFLPQGTGIKFLDAETKLSVEIIGSISVEEYEHGMEIPDDDWSPRDPDQPLDADPGDGGNPTFAIID